jgi:hypothetical protein
MDFVHAEITLKNAGDISVAQRGLIKDAEIRQTDVTALVDTGAITLVINENLRQQLGLGVKRESHATLADDTRTPVKIADPVEVSWKDRSMTCEPLVVAGDGKILLGSIAH